MVNCLRDKSSLPPASFVATSRIPPSCLSANGPLLDFETLDCLSISRNRKKQILTLHPRSNPNKLSRTLQTLKPTPRSTAVKSHSRPTRETSTPIRRLPHDLSRQIDVCPLEVVTTFPRRSERTTIAFLRFLSFRRP